MFRTDPSNRDLDSYLQTWPTFLQENRQFIEHFDFIRDLAVEDPGDSPVIMAKYAKTEVDQFSIHLLERNSKLTHSHQ